MSDHTKHLKKLLTTFISNSGNTQQQKSVFWAYICGWLPEGAAVEVFKKNRLIFSGNEKSLYYDSYRQLRMDKAVEHLDNRKLNEALANLAQEVIAGKGTFKNQSELIIKIKEFLEEIVRPVEDYKILFAIENLGTQIIEAAFWDSELAAYTRDQLIAWGFEPNKDFLFGADFFEGRTLILISEQGTDISQAVRRARVRATRHLRILQHYLKVEFIHDHQLLFFLSNEYAVRRERDGRIVSTGFDRQKSATIYDYPKLLMEGVEEANADFLKIKKLSPKLRALIERALHWIGLAIVELDLDIKISFLSTALETLLTTKADQRKGERIAYRSYLLGRAINPENYHMPQDVLRVYELRSFVVHGAKIAVVSQHDYWLMLDHTQNTLGRFIEFVSEHHFNKQSQIFEKLLQSKDIIPFITWLRDQFDDPYSKKIRIALTDDWLSPKK